MFVATSIDATILPSDAAVADTVEPALVDAPMAAVASRKQRAQAKRMKLGKLALRVRDASNCSQQNQVLAYWLAARRGLEQHDVVGCAFDASRVGGKNYLFGFGTSPDGVGAFLPPQAGQKSGDIHTNCLEVVPSFPALCRTYLGKSGLLFERDPYAVQCFVTTYDHHIRILLFLSCLRFVDHIKI